MATTAETYSYIINYTPFVDCIRSHVICVICVCVNIYICVCVYIYICVCVCVCVCERERERERDSELRTRQGSHLRCSKVPTQLLTE